MKAPCILLFLFFPLGMFAQMNFQEATDSLNHWQSIIGKQASDEVRLEVSSKVGELIDSLLIEQGSFDQDFSAVKGMGILTSPDRAFKIYNWNVPLNDGTHRYECYLQFPGEEDEAPSYLKLESLKKEPTRLEARQFDADEWPGCLYYDIVPVKKGKKTEYYVLLGWDGHNRMTKRKFAEPMTISNGKVRFGKAVFKMEKGVQKRLIFEYSSEVSMSLRYQDKQKRLVFDHLAPRSAGLEGNYAFYGPDLTFDAFELSKGEWEFVENIDIRQERNGKNTPYNDPRPR